MLAVSLGTSSGLTGGGGKHRPGMKYHLPSPCPPPSHLFFPRPAPPSPGCSPCCSGLLGYGQLLSQPAGPTASLPGFLGAPSCASPGTPKLDSMGWKTRDPSKVDGAARAQGRMWGQVLA